MKHKRGVSRKSKAHSAVCSGLLFWKTVWRNNKSKNYKQIHNLKNHFQGNEAFSMRISPSRKEPLLGFRDSWGLASPLSSAYPNCGHSCIFKYCHFGHKIARRALEKALCCSQECWLQLYAFAGCMWPCEPSVSHPSRKIIPVLTPACSPSPLEHGDVNQEHLNNKLPYRIVVIIKCDHVTKTLNTINHYMNMCSYENCYILPTLYTSVILFH